MVWGKVWGVKWGDNRGWDGWGCGFVEEVEGECGVKCRRGICGRLGMFWVVCIISVM